MASSPKPFPVPNATVPFWRTEPDELDSFRSSAALPLEQDYVIIGAGLAGSAIAYFLSDVSEASDAPSITVLEAREACSGASARNGGHVRPDLQIGPSKRMALYGQELAEEIAEFEVANFRAIRDLVREEEIDCEFNVTQANVVFRDEALGEEARASLKALQEARFSTADMVHYTKGKAAEILSGVKDAKVVFSYQGGSIWPYKFVMFLLASAVRRGAGLQTHTPVTRISDRQNDDGFWTVSTPRGDIRARTVIFATNGYTSAILPEYKDRIIPVRGTCTRVAVPHGIDPPHLPSTYSIRHAPNLYDYQITRPDGSIVVGGARIEVIPRVAEWYNVFDDSTLIEPAIPYFDQLMQRTYRGWEKTDAKVSHIWTGIMGYTNDLFPHVGQVPSKPGQWICAGFNGHGNALILLCASGLVAMVKNGVPFELSGIPRLYETSEERLQNSQNEILR